MKDEPGILTPNTKGWRAPWRRDWGDFSDGRSRLSRRKSHYLRVLVLELGTLGPVQRVKAERVAELQAMADRIKASLGKDRGCTVRSWTGLLKLAGNEEARLRAAVAAQREQSPMPLLEALDAQDGGLP